MTIIHSHSHSPTFNLAAEEFLFSKRQEDMLFLYVNEPSVIIGSNQAIRNEVDLDFCVQNNIQVVRRMSGGGAVYHDLGNLNYCFISNKKEGKSSLSSDFLLPITDVLKAMDIPVEIGKRKDLWLPGGTKIGGTASHVGKSRELHHGTLLYDTNLNQLENALTSRFKSTMIKAILSVHSPVRNIRSYMNDRGLEAPLAETFFTQFTLKMLERYPSDSVSGFSKDEISKILHLQNMRYESFEWNYKK